MAKKELTELVTASSSLQDLNGVGPSGAARMIGYIGDIRAVIFRVDLAALSKG